MVLLITSLFLKLPSVLSSYTLMETGKNNVKEVYMYYLIFVVVVGLYFLYFFMIEKVKRSTIKKALSIIMILLSVFIYFGLLFNTVFITSNLISNEPLERQEIVRDSNNELIQNYYECEKALGEFESKFEENINRNPGAGEALYLYNYNNIEAQEVLLKTKPQRDKLFNILNKKIISLPYPTLTNESSKENVNNIISSYKMFNTTLKNFYNCELTEIKMNLHNGNQMTAADRYIALWTSINNLYLAENSSMINYMITAAYSSKIQDFYFKNPKLMPTGKLDNLSEILLNIDKNFNISFQSCL